MLKYSNTAALNLLQAQKSSGKAGQRCNAVESMSVGPPTHLSTAFCSWGSECQLFRRLSGSDLHRCCFRLLATALARRLGLRRRLSGCGRCRSLLHNICFALFTGLLRRSCRLSDGCLKNSVLFVVCHCCCSSSLLGFASPPSGGRRLGCLHLRCFALLSRHCRSNYCIFNVQLRSSCSFGSSSCLLSPGHLLGTKSLRIHNEIQTRAMWRKKTSILSR